VRTWWGERPTNLKRCRMAANDVRYSCGCGFSTKNVEEAERHCDDKKHTLFAHGEIKKD